MANVVSQQRLIRMTADRGDLTHKTEELELELKHRDRLLSEALEQQTATSEILRIISGSPANAQPTFDAIAECATSLCDAVNCLVFRYDGRLLHLVAHHNVIPERLQALRQVFPRPADIGSVTGRVVMSRTVTHVEDITIDKDYALPLATTAGYRSVLGVPMLREGATIGAIIVARDHVAPFSNKQIKLLEIFADQAVIAIENTRLFEEVQARNRDLRVALGQQTATSEVLSVISRSKFDVQPVFDTIARGAARLCGGVMGGVFRYDGRLMDVGAMVNFAPGGEEKWRGLYPMPATRDTATGRAILENSVVTVTDVEADTRAEWARVVARTGGYRSAMAVPMLREGIPIGAIMVARVEPGSFPEAHVDLLRTFADQAVIAIENTRLFEAEQASKRELQRSLEYQTATSEVLNVISRSPSQLQPVVDAIVQTAKHLCSAERATMWRWREGKFDLLAHTIVDPALAKYLKDNPIPPDRTSLATRAVLEGHTMHVPDLQNEPELGSKDQVVVGRIRTLLAVPLLREGEPIGVLSLSKSEVEPFSDTQIALVETFAEQAVIAIENTRLFEEVQARNRDLTALSEVGRAVSLTLDLKIVLKTIVERAVELSGNDAGSIFYYRPETGRFELGETVGLNEETVASFRKLDIATGQTGMGEAIAKREPLPIPDVVQRPSNALRDAALEAGLHAALIVPLLGSEGALGALVLQRRRTGEFPPTVISLMQSLADQSAIALENARLFEKIAQKSRELEIASQHKSQFVANMSHELRTPLAAILGYAELMQEGFYEPLGQKSLDALTRIRSNGKHLLGLINTVLDTAKIESGQFTLNMAEYAIESVVETVRSATESLAQNKNLALKTEVAKSLPIGMGDEQRLTQVLLNLVGNAIKFTDTGEVRVSAKAIDGHFNVSVSDTGPGIPAEHQTRIFQQFQQVDNSNTRAKGGTGLGLAIAKQIIEMHGGRIWVESTLGKGSTFQMELPTRAEFRKSAPNASR